MQFMPYLLEKQFGKEREASTCDSLPLVAMMIITGKKGVKSKMPS